jgi:hypothetical protein
VKIEFTCKDSPDANGRVPVVGEQKYTLLFPLDNGDELRVHMGKEGINTFSSFIASLMVDENEEGNSKIWRGECHRQ